MDPVDKILIDILHTFLYLFVVFFGMKLRKILTKKMITVFKFQYLILAVILALVVYSMIILFDQDDDDQNP